MMRSFKMFKKRRGKHKHNDYRWGNPERGAGSGGTGSGRGTSGP